MVPLMDDMEWVFDRPLTPDFFELAGTHNKAECEKRFAEIPDSYKPTAWMIIQTAVKGVKTFGRMNCLMFRNALFFVYKAMKEKNSDLKLPYYWCPDGIMIKPEWIIRVTNGIVGWSCTEGFDDPNRCGLEDCIYRGLKK